MTRGVSIKYEGLVTLPEWTAALQTLREHTRMLEMASRHNSRLAGAMTLPIIFDLRSNIYTPIVHIG